MRKCELIFGAPFLWGYRPKRLRLDLRYFVARRLESRLRLSPQFPRFFMRALLVRDHLR